MQAKDLAIGDVFVECDPTTWETLSKKDRAKYKRATVERTLGLCGNPYDRFHLRTSRGDWCIPMAAPVTVVEQVSTPAKGLERAA